MSKNKIERYNIISMVDCEYGFSVKCTMPMKSPQWANYFNQITKNNSTKNNVIMGRKTYEDLILKSSDKKLKDRYNYVISKTLNQSEHDDVIIHKNLIDALCSISNKKKIDNIQSKTWIIGGQRIIKEALEFYKSYCNEIHLFKLNYSTHCDLFFPIEFIKENIEGKNTLYKAVIQNINMEAGKILLYNIREKVKPQELQYLDMLKDICNKRKRMNRYGSNYFYTNSKVLEFDISREIPVLTTRTIKYEEIVSKLVEDFSNDYFDQDDLGFRLRCYGKKFENKGSQELNDIIENFISGFAKSNSLNTFNLSSLNDPNFIPFFINFIVSDDKIYLNCEVVYNEIDVCVTLPYHLIYISLIQHICAHIIELKPHKLSVIITRPLVLDDFIDFVDEESKYDPKVWPSCKIVNGLRDINYLKTTDIRIERYESWANPRNNKKYHKLLYDYDRVY